MGLLSRLRAAGRVLGLGKRSTDSTMDESAWTGWGWSVPSVAGIRINQQTALSASAVLACVAMLAEDFAKLTPVLNKHLANGGRTPEKKHFLYDLLYQPNPWQDGFEFREMMQLSLILRGNAYSVIVRDERGQPCKLIPVNADRVALWEAPIGALFYRVTPIGLHEMAQLRDEPFLIPFEDILHVRGFSLNGLLGASRISLAKESIGLNLAQEQLASRVMSNGTVTSGVLATDQKLTKEAAERMAADWREKHSGVQNAGKIAVLEQGLKYQPISLTSTDMEFLASRQFQLAEIARVFRVPLHMLAVSPTGAAAIIVQQAQEYVNYTLAGYTKRWADKLDVTFGLRAKDLFVDWDYSILTRADIATRYNNYRTGIMSMFLTPNEARLDDGREPEPEGDTLYLPMNMAAAGSQSTGTMPDGGGHPLDKEGGTPGADNAPTGQANGIGNGHA